MPSPSNWVGNSGKATVLCSVVLCLRLYHEQTDRFRVLFKGALIGFQGFWDLLISLETGRRDKTARVL